VVEDAPQRFEPDPASVDYDAGWGVWGDMIRHSPAPWHRRRQILHAAAGLSFESVLDAGCGIGETLAAFSERFPARLAGADLSPEVIEQNTRRLPSVRFHTLDLQTDCLDETFDLVVCSEVLEHCSDLPRAVAHLRRMTAGHLIVTVPAGPVFPIDRAMGHHAHLTPAGLTAALEAGGFAPLRVWRWGFPFHSLYKLAINVRPQSTLDGFAGGTYGPGQKALGLALRWLFHFNLLPWGWQLFALARPR
jgi:SAM-dependent methyltransferase